MNKLLKIFSNRPLRKSPFAGVTSVQSISGKGYFVSGVGRSGTHFIASLFSQSPAVDAFHMDDIGDAVGDSFTWYCKWYGLPVSVDGFLRSRSFLIKKAEEKGKIFLESNPMIAFSLEDLNANFDCKFVIMVRNPKNVVESHLTKGWYENVIPDLGPVPGYQYHHERPNHFFSRIMPVDLKEREHWLQLTRHGKIAWMWRMTYERIFQQAKKFNADNFRVYILDEFDFTQYLDLAKFLGAEPVSRDKFDSTSKSRPGKGKQGRSEWNDRSIEEFGKEVMSAVQKFGAYGFKEKWAEL